MTSGVTCTATAGRAWSARTSTRSPPRGRRSPKLLPPRRSAAGAARAWPAAGTRTATPSWGSRIAASDGIGQMDRAVGRVLGALEKAGRTGGAFVVFTTDHGLAMPRAKCTLYDAGLEVALLARWPDGGIRRGDILEQLISNIDVLPTLLEA